MNTSEQCANLSEYVTAQIIQYLRQRDEELIENERLLNIYKTYIVIDECYACKKLIGARKRGAGTDCIYVAGDDGYRRCWNYLEDAGCNTVVCAQCEEEYKYPWHEGNSWFGIPPRPIRDDDYICIDCGTKHKSIV